MDLTNPMTGHPTGSSTMDEILCRTLQSHIESAGVLDDGYSACPAISQGLKSTDFQLFKANCLSYVPGDDKIKKKWDIDIEGLPPMKTEEDNNGIEIEGISVKLERYVISRCAQTTNKSGN